MATIIITTSNDDYLNYNDYQSGLYAESNLFWGDTTVTSTLNTATFPDGVTFNWNGPAVSGAWPIAYPDITA